MQNILIARRIGCLCCSPVSVQVLRPYCMGYACVRRWRRCSWVGLDKKFYWTESSFRVADGVLKILRYSEWIEEGFGPTRKSVSFNFFLFFFKGIEKRVWGIGLIFFFIGGGDGMLEILRSSFFSTWAFLCIDLMIWFSCIDLMRKKRCSGKILF